jgi:hypothetical protein
MKLRLMMAGALAVALPAIAETNLFDNGTWSLIGIEGLNPDAHKIAVTIDKQAAGAYSHLLLQYNFEEVGPARTCEISGEGPIRMLLPPPSAPGGYFELASYWDCATGLVRGVAFTEISFQTKGNSKSALKATGKLSNFDSLEATKVKMEFSPADTNRVQFELKYQLRATRDICVDLTGHDNQDEFRTATINAYYLSAESNQNDLVRYTRIKSKNCDPYSGCHVSKETFCASLAGEGGYLFGVPRAMADPTLALFHTSRLPVETPSLAVDFRSPQRSALKPQAFIAPVADGVVENVSVWANWLGVKKEYRRGHGLKSFRLILFARDPFTPKCDQTKEPAP